MITAIEHEIAAHGYWVVAAMVGLESMGIPLPGETTLVTAAIYAGSTQQLNIALVIIAAAVGGIVGDNVGFWIGRRYGYGLLLRHGRLVRLDEPRLKLGQFLFDRHGGKVVFFGRFIAVLRVVAALLAGINCMQWPRFFFFNAAGAVSWATSYGLAAYLLGQEVERLRRPVAIGGIVLASLTLAGVLVYARRHEAALQAEAERARPGPLDRSRPPCDDR